MLCHISPLQKQDRANHAGAKAAAQGQLPACADINAQTETIADIAKAETCTQQVNAEAMPEQGSALLDIGPPS